MLLYLVSWRSVAYNNIFVIRTDSLFSSFPCVVALSARYVLVRTGTHGHVRGTATYGHVQAGTGTYRHVRAPTGT